VALAQISSRVSEPILRFPGGMQQTFIGDLRLQGTANTTYSKARFFIYLAPFSVVR